MFNLSNYNLIKDAAPYEMDITCIQEPEKSGDIFSDQFINLIKTSTTPEEFDRFCEVFPKHKISQGNNTTLLHTAVEQCNIPLIKHIISIGGKNLLNLFNKLSSMELLPLDFTGECHVIEDMIAVAIQLIKLGSPVTSYSLKNVLDRYLFEERSNYSIRIKKIYKLAKLLILNGALNNKVYYKKTNKEEQFDFNEIKETKFTIKQQAVIDKILVEIDKEKKSQYTFLLCSEVRGFPKDLSREIFSYNNWKIVK